MPHLSWRGSRHSIAPRTAAGATEGCEGLALNSLDSRLPPDLDRGQMTRISTSITRCASARLRVSLMILFTVVVFVLSVSAAQAIPLPGTPSERANTTTPLPPRGDQCSYSPDTIVGIVDFSYSCYGHDLCWQNNSYNGTRQSESSCNRIFLDNMRRECDEQNTGFLSSMPESVCMVAAEDYYTIVASISLLQDVGAPGG